MCAKWSLFVMLLWSAAAQAASICNPADLVGAYAFQLSGLTDISGAPKPTASLGKLVFDGQGNVTGTASATFAGFLLGNPVTGSYEAKSDCSVTWKLQDDSGGFQYFSGTFSTDGSRVQFRQTDPGGAERGIMQKMPDRCSAANLKTRYNFTASGRTTPMQPGETRRTVSAEGTLDTTENNSFQVGSDCTVRFRLVVPGQQPMTMRGFLVNGGKEILAFQTDPGAMVAARLKSP